MVIHFRDSILPLIPVEHLDVLVGMLVQLADAAVDVLWDAAMTGCEDGLLDRLGQQHVLIGMLFEHSLQQERPPRLL